MEERASSSSLSEKDKSPKEEEDLNHEENKTTNDGTSPHLPGNIPRLRRSGASDTELTKKPKGFIQCSTFIHPLESAFRQQRLPAWQPILTPHNVIPTLFILAFIFIPLGVIFVTFSSQALDFDRLSYTQPPYRSKNIPLIIRNA